LRYLYFLFICLGLANCARSKTEASASNLSIGNQFIDAFYSFNKDSLKSLLTSAEEIQPYILYYQKWAECAHYKVLDRTHAFEKNDSTVIFPVTVKDDLMSSLGIDFNVTDTFKISLRDGSIVSIKTSSNDPDEYYQAKEWVMKNRPELVEMACEGIWNGGPAPCECVLGMIQGFVAYSEDKKTLR
jgi:hypothetical protein